MKKPQLDIDWDEEGDQLEIDWAEIAGDSDVSDGTKAPKAEQAKKAETGEETETVFGDNKQSFYRALRNFRNRINTNITDAKMCIFVTFTYDEVRKGRPLMTDPERLHDDWRKFWQKFKRYSKGELGKPSPEYCAAVEPQRSGQLHVHALIFWPLVTDRNTGEVIQSPDIGYVDYNRIREMWGQGYVKAERVESVSNIGAYLSAYLTNLEGGKKGSRLEFYRNIKKPFRCSRGCKYPDVYWTTLDRWQETARHKNLVPGWETCADLWGPVRDANGHDTENNEIKNTINTIYYNTAE